MSRIDELLAEQCPDGVPFRPLGELGRRNAGTQVTAGQMKAMHRPGAPVRIFGAGSTNADVSEAEVPPKSIIREPSILVKSRGHIGFAFVDQPFTHKNELWSYTINHSSVDSRFAYYYLLTRVQGLQGLAAATSVKLPQLAVGDTDRLPIPVPPIEVQREIVAILDTFSALEAELEAELEARRKQYAHFRSLILNHQAAELVRLGDLGRWVGGLTPSKEQPKYWAHGQIPWVASMDVDGSTDIQVRSFVTEAALAETALRTVPGPAVVAVMRSNILRRRLPIGMTTCDVTLNQDVKGLIALPGVEPRYVRLALLDAAERIRAACVRVDGSMAAVDTKRFLAYAIPLPSLAEQGRIAAALDAFDALVSDLSSGLPAELAARRKQYEYYRDKLLTFREAS